MERKNIEMSAQLVGVNRRRSDKAMVLRFESTNEWTSVNEIAEMLSMQDAEGWLLFSMNTFQESDIPTENTPENGRSPSKRLHGVLYAYWKEKGIGGDFNVFYKRKMESIIDSVKEKFPQKGF